MIIIFFLRVLVRKSLFIAFEVLERNPLCLLCVALKALVIPLKNVKLRGVV